jgi:membrane peptidoglycan carboxypeptidase
VKRLDAKITALGAGFTRIPRFPERSTIYARDGKTVLATVYLDNRELVSLNEVSKAAKEAVLAKRGRRLLSATGRSTGGR